MSVLQLRRVTSSRDDKYAFTVILKMSGTSSFRLEASRTPDTPDPDRATRPAAAAAAAAALSGLMAPVWKTHDRKQVTLTHVKQQ